MTPDHEYNPALSFSMGRRHIGVGADPRPRCVADDETAGKCGCEECTADDYNDFKRCEDDR